MHTVLLVTNRRPGEAAGRAEKIESRIRLFSERGWNVEIEVVQAPYILRFPLALTRALRRARVVEPDIVVTMNNPFHMHLIGYAIKRIAGIPWLAEFRDPIATHPDWEGESLLRSIATRVERLTVNTADRVCWYEYIQLASDYFETTYPEVPAERFVKLPPTGYDPANFEGVQPADYATFTITYAGSFYDGWIEPYGFLEGLGDYVATADADIDDIRVQFFGDWDAAYDEAAREAGVTELIETHGFVPHEEVVPALLGSDALLYVGGTDPNNRLNIPSKIWDYLAARKPILGLVDPSFAVAEWIENNGVGLVAHPDDPAAVREAIETLHTGAFTYDPDQAIFDRYSRERCADAFTDVLDAIVRGSD